MQFDLIAGLACLSASQVRSDVFGGTGFLGGQGAVSGGVEADGRARVLNVPARIDITVLEPVTFTVVARTWSKPDGTWHVPYLDTAQRFMVIGTDRSRQVNGAIQDWVYPAPMGA